MAAPVVLFVYNRLEHTQRTVASLLQNSLAPETDLIVFSDGSKPGQSAERVEAVRNYIDGLSGFNRLIVYKRAQNMGLAENIIQGITQVLAEYDRVIVLEDDMLTSPGFLDYMNTALNVYEETHKVASIHGYCYPIKQDLPETFFLKGADCWGWATWRRAWKTFEQNGKKLLVELDRRHLKKQFNFDNTYDYYQMLKGQITGRNNSWAIRWHASCFLQDLYTLYPGQSLIENIGHDGSGTHCGHNGGYHHVALATNIEVKRHQVIENPMAYQAFVDYLRHQRAGKLFRICRRIAKVLFACRSNKH